MRGGGSYQQRLASLDARLSCPLSCSVVRLRFHRVHLRLLPLTVAAIVIMTALPIEIGAPVEWDRDLRGSDFVLNVLLFAPLGIALWRRPIWMIGVVSGLTSAVIESSQVWSIDRFASAYDIAANTLGAVIAALVWRAARPPQSGNEPAAEVVSVGPGVTVALLFVAAGIVSLWWRPAVSSAIAGWDGAYNLQLGNEITGYFGWRGSISSLAILPSAMSRRELRALSAAPVDAWPGLTEGAIHVSTEARVFQGGSSVLLPPEVAADFVERARASQAFTIAVRLRPASLDQRGPARIIEFSGDPFQRNVDLGQEDGALMFRVRTPVTGREGDEWRAVSSRSLGAGVETTVAATYDGAVERIWFDGALVGRLNLAAMGCAVPIVCGEVEKEAWAALGAILALAGLVVLGVPSRGIWISGAVGAAVPLLMYWLHPDRARIASAVWTPALAVVAAIVVVASAVSDPEGRDGIDSGGTPGGH
jgi:hypothetical protein